RDFHVTGVQTCALPISALKQTGLPAQMIKLEITEGMVIQNLDDTIAKMHRLRRHGVSFAMDDFGTGYSSLTYLKRLPVDLLKIEIGRASCRERVQRAVA